MSLPLEELILKNVSELTPFERKVVCAQKEAAAIRKRMEKQGTQLIMGAFLPFEKEQSSADNKVEYESYLRGKHALVLAAEYFTQEKQVPLTAEQYISLQKFAIEHYPKAVWDKSMWFHHFNKVVEEMKIPVNKDVEDYLAQNERLFVERQFADVTRLLPNYDKERAEKRAARMKLKSIKLSRKGLSKINLDPLEATKDAGYIYDVLTGNIDPARLD